MANSKADTFESRKEDHIRLSLEARHQSDSKTGLEKIGLIHEALTELNFSEVDTSIEVLNHKFSAPFFVSSMTAGNTQGFEINKALAKACAEENILMALGSQKRELTDRDAAKEWMKIRSEVSNLHLISNIGLAEVIKYPASQILKIVENAKALALFVHLNPLQEVIQPEGNPDFKGGFKALSELVRQSPVPVLVKEVGCGLGPKSLELLSQTGIYAVDVAGLGGTHWGRIEGSRHPEHSEGSRLSASFANWGLSTVSSLNFAKNHSAKMQVWASGGVRNGLEVAKLRALGAQMIGAAQPFLKAAVEEVSGVSGSVSSEMRVWKKELKTALFCTASKSLNELDEKKVIYEPR